VLAESDGTILHYNAAFTALFAPAAPSPVNFFACLPDETAAALRASIAAAEPRPRPRETRLLHASADTTVVEITRAALPWEGRTILQFHLRDLTERKALETQLLRSQRIELLGQLAGSVVHDMNNVLTAIDGSATMLEMDAGTPALHLQNIHKSVQRAGGMMRQLLMFGRGSDGELQPLDLGGALGEVADLVRETFGKRFLVRCATAGGLPTVLADPTQVHQVVMNLCVNARDAMPEGGILDLTVDRRTIDCAAAALAGGDARPGNYLAVSVRDSGTGIPPEILPRLFDPFFTTKEEGKGTGLGLATVLRLMRRHGGFVTIETAIGCGTCFTCHFPLAKALQPVTVP